MLKLLVIVGPTASGKSVLGLKLAQDFNGEIINADSRSVYRYMDIGTAKPTREEMLLINHHLVDIKNPDGAFSVGEFQQKARSAIESISQRGKLPIMVGGTGLYVDSILYDYQFPVAQSPEMRAELMKLSLPDLVQRLKTIDPVAASTIDLRNPRRVMRAIELAGQWRTKSAIVRPDTLVLGLALSKESIQTRIHQRVDLMLEKGLICEVKRVGEQFGWDKEALTGPAYRSFKDVILADKTIAQGAQEFVRRDMSLAKRQMTWFKRNKEIIWLDAESATGLYQAAKAEVDKWARRDS